MTKSPDKSGPITLFVKLTQNSWWALMNPLDGYLRLEFPSATGPRSPTTPDTIDLVKADRFFGLPGGSVSPGRPFPGLMFGRPPSAREDLFVIRRADDYLYLYHWPNAGKIVDLEGASQGRFSTVSNSLSFELSDRVTSFNGTCKPKNNR